MERHWLVVAVILWAGAAGAQTPYQQLEITGTPPGAVPPIMGAGVPPGVTTTAIGGIEARADFISESDRGKNAKQVQRAWRNAEPNQGVVTFEECAACVYHVKAREVMITTIDLPEGETIRVPIDNADPAGFDVKVRGKNRFAVRPKLVGVDTNINVQTESGKLYPFYIRVLSVKSKEIPNLRVRIEKSAPQETADTQESAFGPVERGVPFGRPAAPAPKRPDESGAPSQAAQKREGVDPLDYVQSGKCFERGVYGFGDFRVFGSEDLKPMQVYRNDCWTFVYYGPARWKEIELPAAFSVFDGIDEAINSRVQGRHTLIVENVSRMITLKVGQKHLCIEYVGSAQVKERLGEIPVASR